MEEMTVNQVAKLLGKTDRTIRNYIKEGRIKARRIENQFGWEYRVYDLGEFTVQTSQAEGKGENASPALPQKTSQIETALQIVSQENQRLWEENRQLREINNRLAYDLGGRDQKIKELELTLEKSLKSLPPAAGKDIGNLPAEGRKTDSKPWWKRLIRR